MSRRPASGRGKAKSSSSFSSSSSAFGHEGLTDSQAELIWVAFQGAVVEIQNGNASKLSFEELYRSAYRLCLHRYGDRLYTGVCDSVRARVEELAVKVSQAGKENLLQQLVDVWTEHKLVVTMLKDVLMYMDKTYVAELRKTPVYDMGMLTFRDLVLRHEQINPVLKQVLLENVKKEREGNVVVDRSLMKSALCMLVEANVGFLQLYEEDFEVSMLEDAEAFYSSESQRLLTDTSSISDYLKTTEQRFSDEDDRATEYLHGSSRQKLREVVQRNLLINNADRIVEDKKSGGMVMLEQDAREDLSRLYRLFSREPETLDKLRKTLKTVVRAHGMQAVQSKDALSKPKQFVTTVVALRTKFQSVVKECFHGDRGCSKTLKEALEYFINMDTRAAKYLSLYVDDLMRNRVQNSTEQQIQVELDNVISMFRYLSEKDIFEDYYKQHLAHRLLTDKTTASDVEKQMIAKLKAECGHQFTSRLEGMFRDIDLSRTLTKGYQTSRAVEKGEVDFNMLILTTGYWPIPYVEDCALPRVAKACCANFEEYYNNLYSGKRIRWQTNLGTAEMLCVFNGQPKELLVHTYQMCILMLFERKEVFTYAEIKAETKIPEQELQRHLLSLAHPKVRVLRKQPNNKELAPEHQFAWNHEYKSNRHRVKIPLLSSKATQMNEDKKDQIANSVLEARKNGVEAAVVRILKTRSTIEHNELVAEVIKLLSHKFLLEPQFIKFRIESLIDREFMRRDEARRSKYHYIS